MVRAVLFFYLVSALLLAACQPAPQTVDDRPLTVTPMVDGGLATVTPTPSPTPEPTPTEAPLTLAELGIPAGQEDFFSGVEGHIKREVIDGEKVYTTTVIYHNGEQKQVKYIIEPGTFDAHTEIYDDLTRPLAVEAYRLDENGRKTEVTLLWQGPERGFREAIDLSGAYDPELNQVDQHPYIHIVHGNRPIQSIKDLPKDDERLTLLQSVRLEQAKAIRAIQAIQEKMDNGEKITAEDLQGSIFLRPLQEKIQKGEKITKDDLYVLFSPKAVENWNKGGGLSLLFEMQNDESKIVYLKSKGNDQPNQTYDSLNMKLALWTYTRDKQGNRHDMAIIAMMDADDVDRYNAGDPFGLQGKWVLAEEVNGIDLTQEYQPADFTQAYKTKKPLFPFIYIHAEGSVLDQYPRLAHILSLPGNKASKLDFWSHDINRRVQQLSQEKKLIEILLDTPGVSYQCPPELQLYGPHPFDLRVSS